MAGRRAFFRELSSDNTSIIVPHLFSTNNNSINVSMLSTTKRGLNRQRLNVTRRHHISHYQRCLR